MILISKLSEEFVDDFSDILREKFHTFSISIQDIKVSGMKILPLKQVYPPMELFRRYLENDISKKKFVKKYTKYMETDKLFEVHIYTIIKALKANTNFCFVCNDKEDYIVLKTFAKYIEKITGIKVYDAEEFKKAIKREAIRLTDDPKVGKSVIKYLSYNNKSKKIAKIFKVVFKSLSKNRLTQDCMSYFNHLDRKFAVDQIMAAALKEGIFKYNTDNNPVILDVGKIKKKKSFINAINITCNEDKTYRKIIKKIFEIHNIKLSPKGLDKLNKSQLVIICAEITTALNKFRNE